MPIDIEILCRDLDPSRTALVLGAGAAIRSGAPTGHELGREIAARFGIEADNSLTLRDIASLAEIRGQRKPLVQFVSQRLARLNPTGGLLNLPLYDWLDIFTTNYDELIEECYKRADRPLKVYNSNYDFGDTNRTNTTSLFKIHGTINKDRSLDNKSSMILTGEDYENFHVYRELIFDKLLHAASSSDVLIIGHSLSDPDIDDIIKKAERRKRESGAPGRIFVMIYAKDENRAILLEQRGLRVCFGSLDEFFLKLALRAPAESLFYADTGSILDRHPALRATTIDVAHALRAQLPSALSLFNGSPATYGDIQADLTFPRDIASIVENQLAGDQRKVAYLLGPAGFGKSTLARQVLAALVKRGMAVWEHINDFPLDANSWKAVIDDCNKKEIKAVLFVDDAHLRLRQIDQIIDHMAAQPQNFFRLLIVSSPPQWHPRSKTPNLYRLGAEHIIKRLSHNEIASLIDLFDRKKEVRELVAAAFAGFSRAEKVRRLGERCKSDMFVCLKNIFSFEDLDDIILREFAELPENLREIYRVVSAMEASNVRVHRQLVIRVTNLQADYVASILTLLSGVITESVVDDRNGIYAWHGRHSVVSDIILKNKFYDQEELFSLYEKICSNINPIYPIEFTTVGELCDPERGIGRIRDLERQNYLYRKLISIAPSHRVPRHRLISNLINQCKYENASSEIRIFEQELRIDAPLIRYKAQIMIEKSIRVEGLMLEDQVVRLMRAAEIIENGLKRFHWNKGLFAAWFDAGVELLKLAGKWDILDRVMPEYEKACEESLDPELSRQFARARTRLDAVSGGTDRP